MTWAATASAAGGAIAGALGSGGGQEKIQPMEHIPEFLRDDYRNLAGQVQGLATPEYYQGQLVASQNPWMQNALQGMGDWGGNMGGNMLQSMYGAGQQGLGAIGQGMNFMQQLQQQGNPFQYDQGTYNQAFQNLTGGMQNAFDLGARQMQQNFDWNMLPGLNMAAALGGQQGSTKQFQQGALGQAMANQNIANFGSGLWQNAANQAHAAGMQGGMNNMQGNQAMLNAYGQFGQLGNSIMNNAYNMGVGNLGLGLKAGQIQQGYDQSLIDAAMKKHNFEQQAPWTALQTQLSMLPGPGQVKAGVPGMSPWEGAMNGAITGAGAYGAGVDAGWWGK